MANTNLKEAKAAKNDEFYTQFHDIEIEMNAYLEYDPDAVCRCSAVCIQTIAAGMLHVGLHQTVEHHRMRALAVVIAEKKLIHKEFLLT